MAESKDSSANVAASVSPELKRKIRIAAAKEDMTMSKFVRNALEEYIEEMESKD